MSQPPQSPDPRRPQDPQGPAGPQQPQYGAAESAPPPTLPQRGEGGGRSGLGKGPIIAIVGCALLTLVLILSLVAFFAVRALTSDDEDPTVAAETSEPAEEAPAGAGTSEPIEEEPSESTEPADTTTEAADEGPAAAGEANAQPKGTAIPLENQGSDASGTVDIVVGDVNWDATGWVAEQNKFNETPPEGQKYIMAQAEVTYHGSADFTPRAWKPADFVGADGEIYDEAGVVTPDTLGAEAITDGGSLTVHWVFAVPTDLPEGGHFVIADALPADEAVIEGQWVAAT